MSDTPRTDEFAWDAADWDAPIAEMVVPADFARQLEQEANRLREAVEWLLDCATGETPQSMQDAITFAKQVIGKR
jgi:hypothetical protein